MFKQFCQLVPIWKPTVSLISITEYPADCSSSVNKPNIYYQKDLYITRHIVLRNVVSSMTSSLKSDHQVWKLNPGCFFSFILFSKNEPVFSIIVKQQQPRMYIINRTWMCTSMKESTSLKNISTSFTKQKF